MASWVRAAALAVTWSAILGACAAVREAPRSAAPDGVYDPVAAGEALPPGYYDVVRRDDIAPIYQPTFVAASQVVWSDDTLVIGVELEGRSKAYPVDELNHREMVVDRLGGIPILVTW